MKSMAHPSIMILCLEWRIQLSMMIKLSMQVYPNPTRDLVMVQMAGESGYSTMLKVYDMHGTLHHQEEFTSYTELSMAALDVSYGVYLVEVVSPAGRLVKKVIYTP